MIATESTSLGRRSDTDRGTNASQGRSPQQHTIAPQESAPEQNVGNTERTVSVVAGGILALLGLGRRSIPGLITAGVGAMMVQRGYTGHCGMYEKFGVNTAQDHEQSGTDRIEQNGIEVATSYLINKSPEELYAFWRNFENLPQIMEHLESVTGGADGKTHWVAKAPAIVGGKVEWDAQITADEPNSRIAWRSLPGSQIDTAGEIRFAKYPLGDRGTEVHVKMHYRPPAGKLGHYLISMLGSNPKRMVREDLRNFKRLMELGEILTIEGQSRGTCTGQGQRQHESEWKPLFK